MAEATPPPNGDRRSYRHAFAVPPEAIDDNGHVNNVVYVQWMQDIAVLHFEALGGMSLLERFGAMWVARSHRVEYLRPAFAGHVIDARTWVDGIRRVRSLRRYAFHDHQTGQLLARGETDWVLVRTATGRPMTIPEPMRGLMGPMPVG